MATAPPLQRQAPETHHHHPRAWQNYTDMQHKLPSEVLANIWLFALIWITQKKTQTKRKFAKVEGLILSVTTMNTECNNGIYWQQNRSAEKIHASPAPVQGEPRTIIYQSSQETLKCAGGSSLTKSPLTPNWLKAKTQQMLQFKELVGEKKNRSLDQLYPRKITEYQEENYTPKPWRQNVWQWKRYGEDRNA